MNRYEALKHAVKAHGGTVDKCGQPYVLHPIAVAEAIPMTLPKEAPERWRMEWYFGSGCEDAEVVALLHDVWEDTDYGPLSPLSGDQAVALCLITRQPGESYGDYIEGVCSDATASIVKLADLWHNLQPERQACLPEKERKSLERRYLKAREQIWESLGFRWWPEPLEGE